MHPSYLRLLSLSLFFLFTGFLLQAQSGDRLFRLNTAAVELSQEVKDGLKNFTLLTVDRNELQKIVRNQPEQLRLNIPFENGLEVTLKTADIFAEGFLLRAGNKAETDTLDYSGGGYYQGELVNQQQSVAAISFFSDDVIGVLADAKGNINLGRLPGSAADGDQLLLIMYREQDIVASPNFSCAVPDQPIRAADDLLPHEELGGGVQKLLPNVCFSSYLEGDFDLYQSRGSNLTDATNWLTGVWNVVNALFNNDQITADISEIFIWTSPDGYPESSSGTAHDAFSDAMSGGFNGDLAHLITRDGNNNGGRAWLNVVCSNNSYYKTAYSEISGSYASLPNYSWTINVLSHESGHNLGSQHTHSCSWNGNNTQIDDAGNVYFANNGQTPEGEDCFDENNPIIPSNGGTIMSYAHLLSGVGINFSLGFGPQPGNRIRAALANCSDCSSNPVLGCTDPNAHNYNPAATQNDGSCIDCNDGVQNGDETGIDCGGALCTPCGCSAYTDPVFNLPATLCSSDAFLALPANSENNFTGQWYLGTTIVTGFDPANYAGQNVSLQFIPTEGQCANVFNITISVTTATLPEFDIPQQFCATDPAFNLDNVSLNGISGNWSINGNTLNFQFYPSLFGEGTYTLDFIPTNGQCAEAGSFVVMVIAQSICDPIVGCTDQNAHNYNSQATQSDGSCETCFDGILNGDETEVDCGGSLCEPCGCTVFTTPVFNNLPSSACSDGNPFGLPPLSSNGLIGVWSLNGFTINFIDPPNYAGQTLELTYTPNADQCGEIFMVSIDILDASSPQFNLATDLCANDAVFDLPTSSDNNIDGRWYLGNNQVFFIEPASYAGQTVNLQFTPDQGQCSEPVNLTLNIQQEIVPSFNLPTLVCETDGVVNLDNVSLNGVQGNWFLGGNTLNFQFFPALFGEGTYVLEFIPENADDCVVTAQISITVEAREVCDPITGCTDPNAHNYNSQATQNDGSCETCSDGILNGDETGIDCGGSLCEPCGCTTTSDPVFTTLPTTLCEDENTLFLPAQSSNGFLGVWYLGGMTASSIQPADYAGQTIELTFIPNEGQCGNTISVFLSIDELTIPEFNLPSVVCATDGVINLDNVSLNGIQGNWFLGGNTLSFQFFPALFGAGTYTLEFIPENADDCVVTAQISITVEAREVCDPITGCTDPNTHNYNPQATQNDGSCETCFDGILNGDETSIDCGGSLCEPCGCDDYITPVFVSLMDTLCSRWQHFALPGLSDNELEGSWTPASLVTDNVLDLTGLSNGNITLVFVPTAVSCGEEIAVDFYVSDLCLPLDSLIIAGAIYTPDSVYLDDIPVLVTDSSFLDSMATVTSGTYVSRWPLLNDSSFVVRPLQPTDSSAARAGIDIVDLITLRRYLLGLGDLSLYQLIAADVDGSAQLNVFDMIISAKLVLGTQDTIPGNRVYQYIDADYVFPDVNDPWAEAIPDFRVIDTLNTDSLTNDFLAIKLGDISGLADSDNFAVTENFGLDNQSFSANQLVEVFMPATARRGTHDMVYLEVNYNPDLLRWAGRAGIAGVAPRLASEQKAGYLKLWWLAEEINSSQLQDIGLSFISRSAGELYGNFSLTSKSGWLNTNGEWFTLAISPEKSLVVDKLVIYPNPTHGKINYKMTDFGSSNEPATAILSDLGGRTVWMRSLATESGSIDLRTGTTGLANGVYFLTIQKGDLLERRKVVLLNHGN